MHKKPNQNESSDPMPTDAEIAAAAERLSQTWRNPAPRAHGGGATKINQSLARGRSHTVACEVKRPPRNSGGTR
jgi:hypothetical protein